MTLLITKGFVPHRSNATLNGKRISLKKAEMLIKDNGLEKHFIGNYSYGQMYSYSK